MLSLSGVRKWTKVHLAIYIALDMEVLSLFTTIKAQNLKKNELNYNLVTNERILVSDDYFYNS